MNRAWGIFPSGTRLHDEAIGESLNWRVYTLPFLEEFQLLEQIGPRENEGYDNKVLLSPKIFYCPSLPTEPITSDASGVWGWSTYDGVAGARIGDENTAEGETGVWPLPTPEVYGDVSINGMLFPDSKVKTGQVVDGTSNTFLIGERAYLGGFYNWVVGSLWVDGDRKILIVFTCLQPGMFVIQLMPTRMSLVTLAWTPVLQ